MDETKTKCSKCKCFRNNEDFIKEDKVLKTCVKCRDNSRKDKEPNTTKDNDLTRYIRHQKVFKN